MLMAGVGSREYITDGCVLLLDATQNTRAGHNLNTKTWEDLSGAGHDFTVVTKSAMPWGENYLRLDQTNSPASVADYCKGGMMHYPQVTLEFCGYADDTSYTAYQGLRTLANFNVGGYGLLNIGSQGGCYCRVSGVSKQIGASPDPRTNQLYRETMTYDGQFLCFYWNGVLQAQLPTIGEINASTTPMAIGVKLSEAGAPGYTGGNFGGKVYAARMYNRALTPSEILHNSRVDKQKFRL